MPILSVLHGSFLALALIKNRWKTNCSGCRLLGWNNSSKLDFAKSYGDLVTDNSYLEQLKIRKR